MSRSAHSYPTPQTSKNSQYYSNKVRVLLKYLRVIGVLGGSVPRICLSRTRADRSSVESMSKLS